MTAAQATNKEGGAIILVAGRADGTGGEGFYHNPAHESPTLSRK
jgi:nickel-dependent lactate racemase